MLLSIITINYNNADGLRKTIESVKMQKDADQMEYIIIDGGSTDGSKEIIIEAGHAISQWVSEPDNGIYNAMNKGVGMANGKYCLFLNSGDSLHDCHVVSELVNHIAGLRTDFIIGKIWMEKFKKYSSTPQDITLMCFLNEGIPHPSTLIKTTLLIDNPYDESQRIVSDWKFFLQELIFRNASYQIIDTVVTDFDCEGISNMNPGLGERERNRIFEELLPERIRTDYDLFKNCVISDTPYDRFFNKLRSHKSSGFIYSSAVVLFRIASLFFNEFKFARDFPVRLPRNQ